MRTILKKGDLAINIQFTTPAIIKTGDQFRLMVGTRPKVGTPCFIPDFANWDPMVGGKNDTARFFVPVKSGKVTDQAKILSDMKPGEIYWVKVIDWAFHPNKKTGDKRIMIFFNVQIIKRVEEVTGQIDQEKSVYIKSVFSGKTLVSREVIPVKLEKKDMIQNGRVYRFLVAMDSDKIIGWQFYEIMGGTINEYARRISETAKIPFKLALSAAKKLPDVKDFKWTS
jgi:hypothetical protein